MRKNYLLIVLTNVLSVFILICLFEICVYNIEVKRLGYNPEYNLFRQDFSFEYLKKYKQLREPCGLQYKKRPILIYGCSYAYGSGLSDTEHFGYLLSEATKRPVYNFGVQGGSLQHSLHIMQNQTKIEPEPEFIIYVLINDQIRRMQMPSTSLDNYNFFEYVKKDDDLILKKDKLKYLKNTMLYQSFLREIKYHSYTENSKFNLLKSYLKELKKLSDKNYPNAKFILIIYNTMWSFENSTISKERLKEINDLGIDIIYLENIFGDILEKPEYRLENDNNHPNKKAWELIIPEIIKLEKI